MIHIYSMSCVDCTRHVVQQSCLSLKMAICILRYETIWTDTFLLADLVFNEANLPVHLSQVRVFPVL